MDSELIETTTHPDPDKYGERGAVAGRPDLEYDDGIDHLGALRRALRPADTRPLLSGRARLAKGQARRAMEALSGMERVALATAPELTFADEDVDALARMYGEDRTEGRTWPRRPNPHDD